MQSSGHRRKRTALVLAWFVLFVAASIASPFLRHAGAQLICHGGGVDVVDTENGDTGGKKTAGMDCPLCASLAAPPVARAVAQPPSLLAYALQPVVAARLAWLTRAPFPARGPPVAV